MLRRNLVAMTLTETRPPGAAEPAPGRTPGGPGGRHRTADPVPAPRRRPAWELPGLLVLLLGTGVLYLWNLSASGWANSFYAAAVQAGTQSWTAFFFGSLDAGNAITVDKPPAALWVMELSARIFGFTSWSLLVPQALMGVAAVAVLYATVRRVAGAARRTRRRRGVRADPGRGADVPVRQPGRAAHTAARGRRVHDDPGLGDGVDAGRAPAGSCWPAS